MKKPTRTLVDTRARTRIDSLARDVKQLERERGITESAAAKLFKDVRALERDITTVGDRLTEHLEAAAKPEPPKAERPGQPPIVGLVFASRIVPDSECTIHRIDDNGVYWRLLSGKETGTETANAVEWLRGGSWIVKRLPPPVVGMRVWCDGETHTVTEPGTLRNDRTGGHMVVGPDSWTPTHVVILSAPPPAEVPPCPIAGPHDCDRTAHAKATTGEPSDAELRHLDSLVPYSGTLNDDIRRALYRAGLVAGLERADRLAREAMNRVDAVEAIDAEITKAKGEGNV